MLTLCTGCEGNLLDKITPRKKVSGNGDITSNEYKLSDNIYSFSINEINFLGCLESIIFFKHDDQVLMSEHH